MAVFPPIFVADTKIIYGYNSVAPLKDHNPTVRLLNPAKNEFGRISKTILDKIKVNFSNSLHLNQWKNTQEVIDWFKGIDNKQSNKFIMFDIKDFYPSISKELLNYALKVQSCILCNNKYMIASTQLINTEVFAFIADLVFKLLSRKILFISIKDNRNC